MKTKTKAQEFAEVNNMSEEINQAYINIVGEEYAKAGDVQEAYQGQFSSDEDFARDMAESTGAVDGNNMRDSAWPLYCIDWEWAARELMMDYSENGGYYFRNL